MDSLEKYKKNRIVKKNAFISRIKAIFRILTNKIFILINYDLNESKEGIFMTTKVLIRTDYNRIADEAAIWNAKQMKP